MWQPIAGWEHYEVSRDGKVRRASDGYILQTWRNDQGYELVRLSGPRTVQRVHRLVAIAHIANPDGKPCVNHINNERADNRAENLEWCTQWENIRHADNQGRMQRDFWRGKRSPNAALNDNQVREIRAEYSNGGISQAALGVKYGVSKKVVACLLARQTYADVA